MLNNQKGFSLFSIIAAIVVMGFLGTVAITKMTSGIEQIQQSAAGIAAARSLTSMEGQMYAAFRLSEPSAATDAVYFSWLLDEVKAEYFPMAAGTELGDMEYYSWVALPVAAGGQMEFQKDGTGTVYPFTLQRKGTNNGPGRWTVNNTP
jgi:type II secretory pathway pseudopilin PulG